MLRTLERDIQIPSHGFILVMILCSFVSFNLIYDHAVFKNLEIIPIDLDLKNNLFEMIPFVEFMEKTNYVAEQSFKFFKSFVTLSGGIIGGIAGFDYLLEKHISTFTPSLPDPAPSSNIVSPPHIDNSLNYTPYVPCSNSHDDHSNDCSLEKSN